MDDVSEQPTVIVAHRDAARCSELVESFLDDGWTVVGPVSTAEDTIAIIEEFLPDVAVIDADLTADGGGTMAELLARQAPSTVVVLISSAHEEAMHSLMQGAFSVVEASAAADHVVRAAIGARRGEAVMTPMVAGLVLDRLELLSADREPGTHGLPTLTVTEREVMSRLAEGWSPAMIAAHYEVTERLVNLHPGYAVVKLQRIALGRRLLDGALSGSPGRTGSF